MAKHVFRFPIVAMLLALLSVSIPALADNLDLASAQPEFDRAVTLSFSGFNNNSEWYSLDHPGADFGLMEDSFRNSVLSHTGSSRHGCIAENEISFHHRYPELSGFRDIQKRRRLRLEEAPEQRAGTCISPLLGTGILVMAFSLKKRLQR